jgi:hypothetical protein
MVRKTQIKKKKSKSQLRKTLKHYSKTNKKGGRWGHKNSGKGNQIMPPPTDNRFANRTGVKQNPLFKNNNNNNNNNNSTLPSEVNTSSFFNRVLYGNTGSLDSGFIYNNSQSLFSGKSNIGSSNGQSLSNRSNGLELYTPMIPVYNNVGPQTLPNNSLYTPMNQMNQEYTNVGVPGEATLIKNSKLRKTLNNGNLLNGTANA